MVTQYSIIADIWEPSDISIMIPKVAKNTRIQSVQENYAQQQKVRQAES